ncbi:MAG: NADH-quinone oxidoreductase subunit C [Actinobacteria bacterium]|nr:NADH-quinone oxidoreductase subunit C [Actinomycetota bacterium]
MNVSADEWRTAAAAVRANGSAWFAMLTAVDDPDAGVVEVVLIVGEPGAQQQLRCAVDRSAPVLASVADLWPGAAFAEREVHEMFGVDFAGNCDMRPLLLPTDVETPPLRRDAGLSRRAATEWPGAVEPGDAAKARRRPVVSLGADSEKWAVEL